MKNIIPFFFLQMMALNLFAQAPCDDDIIMAVKGKWTKRADPPAVHEQAKLRLSQMQKIIQAAYPEPKGIDARWYAVSINKPLIENGPMTFQLTSGFFEYYCNKNMKKLMRIGETGTWFYVYTNQFRWFLDEDIFFTIQHQPVYLLRKKTGEIRGYPVFEGLNNLNTNLGNHYSRAIIITRGAELPYVPVTRKEYLIAYLDRMEKGSPKQLEMIEKLPMRSDIEEEENKKAQLEKIERTTAPEKVAKAKDLFLRSYVTDKQRRKEDVDRLKKMIEDGMKPARDLLATMTEDESSQPAIVDDTYADQFKEFSTEEKGGRPMVRLNPGYFNMKLPKYVPQFLIAYWSCDQGIPQDYWKEQIEKNVDFDALKAMIDK